jgi:hypothetical protein
MDSKSEESNEKVARLESEIGELKKMVASLVVQNEPEVNTEAQSEVKIDKRSREYKNSIK